jgi:hypothetical protein
LQLEPMIAALILFGLSTAIGMFNVVKIITIYEAKHELRHGSAGWIRAISGWSLIIIWVLVTWFLSTIIGNWYISGDLEGAMERAELRFWVMLEIISAVADSDS